METLDILTPDSPRIVEVFQHAGKAFVLALITLLMAATATADWWAGTQVSMGVLYVVPIMIAAAVFPPSAVAVLSVLCAMLGLLFYHPDSALETTLHLFFALTANLSAGLFMNSVIRNRQLVVRYLDQISREQTLRRVAEEQLHVLAESSPAGILTLDEAGTVLAANKAAHLLFAVPQGETIVGRSMEDYLPVLSEALRIARDKKPFQNAAQCKGRRQNGEMFLADTWFSTYRAPNGLRLAAIIVDSSEELRDREERHLLQVSMTNRVTVAAVSHEIRNFCAAISLLYSNMRHSHEFQHSRRFRELGNLVDGLEKIAVMELESTIAEMLEEVPLKQVLEDLRIIIEPAWKDIGGAVRWLVAEHVPVIQCHRHGLLQAFLNLSQNSLRAVRGSHRPGLTIDVSQAGQRVTVRFRDTGPGVSEPDSLFRPFRPGSGSTGMGLYVSRAILRHFGGDLRYEPEKNGACFAVELEVAAATVPV